MTATSIDFSSVLGFGDHHDPETQRHGAKGDVAKIDWTRLIPIQENSAYASTSQPDRAQHNERNHRTPPKTLKAMLTPMLCRKFTPRASINGYLRLRGHTDSMSGRLAVVSAGSVGTDILSAVENCQEHKDAGRPRDHNQQEARHAAGQILAHAAAPTPVRGRGPGSKLEILREWTPNRPVHFYDITGFLARGRACARRPGNG